jgi:hypothetical protein
MDKQVKEFREMLDDTFRAMSNSLKDSTSTTDQYIRHKLNGWLVDLWSRSGTYGGRRQYSSAEYVKIELDVSDINVEFDFKVQDQKIFIRYEGSHNGSFNAIDIHTDFKPAMSERIKCLLQLALVDTEWPALHE